jgi:hypothetical protein
MEDFLYYFEVQLNPQTNKHFLEYKRMRNTVNAKGEELYIIVIMSL